MTASAQSGAKDEAILQEDQQQNHTENNPVNHERQQAVTAQKNQKPVDATERH